MQQDHRRRRAIGGIPDARPVMFDKPLPDVGSNGGAPCAAKRVNSSSVCIFSSSFADVVRQQGIKVYIAPASGAVRFPDIYLREESQWRTVR